MNETAKRGCMLLLACLFTFTLGSCKTITAIDTSKTDSLFVDVIETQTEVITTGNDVANTIDDIKAITDDAKVTCEIPKEKVITLIKYVDQSAEQIKAHNAVAKTLADKITDLERSRIDDNSNTFKVIAEKQGEIDRQKTKASIFFRWALIATVIAFVLAGILWLPKLLKMLI